jgi:guanylate kinase
MASLRPSSADIVTIIAESNFGKDTVVRALVPGDRPEFE